MRYTLVVSADINYFEEAVSRYLDHGWEPVGGVSSTQVSPGTDGYEGLVGPTVEYAQALVHEEDEPVFPDLDDLDEDE
jgi:hypothetical protein